MKSLKPMMVCKLCFHEFDDTSLLQLFHDKFYVCKRCLKEISAKFIHFEVDGYKALSIYEYDDRIQALLYQFKGCYDIELGDVFMSRYAKELRIKYLNYIIVPIPSYIEDDEIREFNHVEEIFKYLKLPMLKLLVKTEKVKQALLNSEERKQVANHLALREEPNLSNKRILLVDDVYTTGATMKAAIKLIESLHPKTIKVLVMSKTKIK